eukprot:CAMPEP_0194332972 /NCGR_PEP_ID=MMETSP0171-20130528/61144_1 /TAXON_ID=218684 /ORGANISM="Corethron pennatum, Strain L29A3" /LENGTH=246 /DNA_ID=CAMNT_0039095049 /DNA_START=60 /DNA_END=796 /DNA_ORIENTATION=-
MRFHPLMLVLNAAYLTKVASQAEQNDHLTCFKIKDGLKLENVAVDMIANKAQEEYTVRDCELKKNKGAFRMCIPSSKTVLTPDVADPSLGGLVDAYDPDRCLQNDFLCYRVTCAQIKPKLKARLVIDQFNRKGEDRKIKFLKKGIEICTPAWKLTGDNEVVVIECPSPSVVPSSSPSECDDGNTVFTWPNSIPSQYPCSDLLSLAGLLFKVCMNSPPVNIEMCCTSCPEGDSAVPSSSPSACVDDS